MIFKQLKLRNFKSHINSTIDFDEGISLIVGLNGSGKLKRKHAFKSHILTKKSKKRKLALTHSALVHKSDVRSIKEQLRIM